MDITRIGRNPAADPQKARACAACDPGHPDLKVEVIVTAAVR